MKLYSIYLPTVSHIDIQATLGTVLDDLFTYIIPWKLIGHAIDQNFWSTSVTDDIVYSERYK